ncbi:MAG: ATP synthase F1 subunit delta [Velocimicrobium sp.]
MAKLISKTYGEALFKISIEENQLDSLAAEAKNLLDVFRSNEELSKVLNHPNISSDEKVQLIERIFKGNVSDNMVGFLVIIIEKGRYDELQAIFKYFLSEVMEYKNIGVAYVTSATVLLNEQKKQIENRLLDITKYVQFIMNYDVDESLIGGMVIRIGDRVVDSSIRTKLNTMAGELKKIQLT